MKINFSKMMSHRSHAGRRGVNNAYDNPRRHWWIGLLTFSMVVFIGSAVLARMYFINESLDTLVGADTSSIPEYQETLIHDVLAIYAERSVRYQSLISGGAAVITIETASSTNSVELASSTVGSEATLLED